MFANVIDKHSRFCCLNVDKVEPVSLKGVLKFANKIWTKRTFPLRHSLCLPVSVVRWEWVGDQLRILSLIGRSIAVFDSCKTHAVVHETATEYLPSRSLKNKITSYRRLLPHKIIERKYNISARFNHNVLRLWKRKIQWKLFKTSVA